MTIPLKDIFLKDIDRHIDGVIKADDASSLTVELEEYVVTKEVSKRLQAFLDAYNGGKSGNGVWISGFFGSGKSHLLKMLALLLENRETDGRTPLSFFEEKFHDDIFILEALRKASRIPSRSVLFNIDQQANAVAKDQADALLSVFVRVFDDMQGYYGQMPHVADFERHLDENGHLNAFRAAFERITGKAWEIGRRSANMSGRAITDAFTEVTGNEVPSGNILRDYREDRTLSIADFAERVRAYIDRQQKTAPGFRLNFFVDEVGQYIADNVRLMTNLQTIAESLNTRCEGRAWIVVTAQQEMDTIIGEMNRSAGSDFSKIMGRFDVKLPLNAADVAEVIQQRLLLKKPGFQTDLGLLYDDHAENLRTLFEFGDGTQTMRGFRDRDHFIKSYPFHPYQYELFQKAIRTLSDQNAFEGRHTSTGERSMLGAFQEVGRAMMREPLGALATFDRMFEGVRAVLKASAQHAILSAERQIGEQNPFAVRVLKALFLVKYVDEFKPTARNVAILMQDRLDLDPTRHKREVDRALGLLEQESYVQRNGDLYEFLTDEEKDIEQKIKTIGLDASDVSRELADMLFGEILGGRKAIAHEGSGQTFPFSQRVHHALITREHPLAINLITPYMAPSERGDQTLATRSITNNELLIVLREESWLVDELATFLKTKRYLTRETSTEHREGVTAILRAKGANNDARRRRILAGLRERISEADLLVRGEKLDLRTSDPKGRIEAGFQTLVDRVFTSLSMLRGVNYKESDLTRHLETPDDGQITEAESEILNRITANQKNALRSTAKGLIEAFEKPPYGWPEPATLCLIGLLIGRGRLEPFVSGEALDGNGVREALLNTTIRPNLTLEPSAAIDQAHVMRARRVFQDLFGRSSTSIDWKGLGREIGERIEEMARSVDEHMARDRDYPFVSALAPFRTALMEVRGKSSFVSVCHLAYPTGDALAEQKEDLFDPIDTFLRGPQREILDDARRFLLTEEANLDFAENDLVGRVRTAITADDVYRGMRVQGIKTDLDRLKSDIRGLVAREREAAAAELRTLSDELLVSAEFTEASPPAQAEVQAALAALENRITQERLIPSIRTVLSGFRRDRYPQLISRLLHSKPRPDPEPRPGGTVENAPPASEPVVIVPLSELGVRFGRPLISSEADVEEYLSTMRAAMLGAVRNGKRITP
jgi:energy-coupling factor transporter ATP-binding protein EcfA2